MEIKYSIDAVYLKKGQCEIRGWAVGNEKQHVQPGIKCGQESVDVILTRNPRKDVAAELFGERKMNDYGFSLTFDYDRHRKYTFELDADGTHVSIPLNRRIIFLNRLRGFRDQAVSTLSRTGNKQEGIFENFYTYDSFRRKMKMDERKVKKEDVLSNESPVFSIVIPLYATPVNFLRELIESIEKQTYPKYEVCFADGSRENEKLESIINEYQKKNHRIRYHYLNGNRGISGNTNAALEMATGDFVVLCDHDDLLDRDALYELAKAIKHHPECDCIYSDEDKVDETSEKYFDPHFKPDFNIDLLCSVNYICHLYAVRRSLIKETGGFDAEYDGAQDHDFIFRTTEKARQIVHIPKVLYHWRTHLGSTSANPESKLYAYEAGKKAVRAHYERVWPQLEIEKVEDGISKGIYHTYFNVKEELVSVIIPNKDHTEDLDKAIRSLIEKGTWKNLEFIIVENNSESAETFEYYSRIQQEYPQVKVVYYKGSFNYSRINNFGVKHAEGRYILLMNNDVELINPDSIREMMGYAQRDDVGIVGCRLMYEDDTIQHAGVIVGIQGIADHAFKGKSPYEPHYFSRSMVVQDYSAVTAAVLLTKREVYDAVNGLDETFEVAFNDIDFCLRVGQTGKLVVYNPYACFYHYESKSRGLEDNEEKLRRFHGEVYRFASRYHDFMEKGDPMYNPNLSIVRNDYSLRNLYRFKPGQPFYTKEDLRVLKESVE